MRQFKYLELANQLKAEIDQGKWLAEEKLPSIRALALHYQLSKISVQKALHSLEARGLIYVKAKSGYYVSQALEQQNAPSNLLSISQPKHVEMPDVFYDIMERGAAFDIAPPSHSNHQHTDHTASHLLLLNRHLSRAIRHKPTKNALYYSEPAGDLVLRQQISQHYRKRGLSVSADDICITAGCQNSLFLALISQCNAGDIVAVESPAFYGVLQLLQQLKLKVIELPSSTTTGVNAQSLEDAAAIWPIKACILTPSFATPSGAQIPDHQKQSIVEVAQRHQITLIEDDIYGDLGFHNIVKPLKAFDHEGQVILCGSLSKSLSRDLRLGWIIAKQQKQKLVHIKLINQLATSQSIQQGVSSFIAEGHFERHLAQYRKTLLKQRDQLIEALDKYWLRTLKLPIKFTVPDGGLAIWIELPKTVNTLALYHQAIKQNIVLTPGQLFTSTTSFSHQLRLSFAHPTTGHRLEALKTLGELCKAAWRK